MGSRPPTIEVINYSLNTPLPLLTDAPPLTSMSTPSSLSSLPVSLSQLKSLPLTFSSPSEIEEREEFHSDSDSGISQGYRSLRWSRDKVVWHMCCLVLFQSVQACFLSILAEDTCCLGLGELTFLRLSTIYTLTITGCSIRYVLLEGPQCARSECFR